MSPSICKLSRRVEQGREAAGEGSSMPCGPQSHWNIRRPKPARGLLVQQEIHQLQRPFSRTLCRKVLAVRFEIIYLPCLAVRTRHRAVRPEIRTPGEPRHITFLVIDRPDARVPKKSGAHQCELTEDDPADREGRFVGERLRIPRCCGIAAIHAAG